MKEFVEKLIEWLEEISVSKSEEGIINGCNMGICEDDDCLKCLKNKLISNINKLAEEYSKTGNCMNDCEHYDSLANYIYSKGYNAAIDDVIKLVEFLIADLDVEGCTKYGNENAEQEKKSYDTLMKYEIAGSIDDLLCRLEVLKD